MPTKKPAAKPNAKPGSKPGSAKGRPKSPPKDEHAEEEANAAAALALAQAEQEAAAALAAAAEAAAARRRPPVDERQVEEAELLEFLFPTQPRRLYHSASAARLYLFARHGPLVGGQIMGGRFDRRRALSASELELILDQTVCEDLLAVFVGDRQLQPHEQEEVLSEARGLRARCYDYTQAEVEVSARAGAAPARHGGRTRPHARRPTPLRRPSLAPPLRPQHFLAQLRIARGLPQGASLPFAALQRAIELERTRRAKALRLSGPALVSAAKPPEPSPGGGLATVTALQRLRFAPRSAAPAPAKRARMPGAVLVHGLAATTDLPRFQREALGEAFGPVRSVFWRADAAGRQSGVAVVVLASDSASHAALAQLEGRAYRGRRLHLELPLVPEPELSSFAQTEALLSKTAFSIAQLGVNAADPGLRQNALLVRSGGAPRRPQAQAQRPAARENRPQNDLRATRGPEDDSWAAKTAATLMPEAGAPELLRRTVTG